MAFNKDCLVIVSFHPDLSDQKRIPVTNTGAAWRIARIYLRKGYSVAFSVELLNKLGE